MLDLVAESLRDTSVNGGVAEGHRTQAQHTGQATRASKFPWFASTLWRNHNLKYYKGRIECAGVDLQHVWGIWTSVLQTYTICSNRVLMWKHHRVLDEVHNTMIMEGLTHTMWEII